MARKASIFVRELTDKEKQKLTSIKKKRNIDYSLRQRAYIILLSAQSCEVKLIAHRTELDQSNVNKWIKRFNEGVVLTPLEIFRNREEPRKSLRTLSLK